MVTAETDNRNLLLTLSFGKYASFTNFIFRRVFNSNSGKLLRSAAYPLKLYKVNSNYHEVTMSYDDVTLAFQNLYYHNDILTSLFCEATWTLTKKVSAVLTLFLNFWGVWIHLANLKYNEGTFLVK